jgi:hypothetical protein
VVECQVSPVNLIWARRKKSAGRKGIIGFLFQNTPGVLVLLPLACRCSPTSEKGLGDRKSAGVVLFLQSAHHIPYGFHGVEWHRDSKERPGFALGEQR